MSNRYAGGIDTKTGAVQVVDSEQNWLPVLTINPDIPQVNAIAISLDLVAGLNKMGDQYGDTPILLPISDS
jgi:hypothetical protein